MTSPFMFITSILVLGITNGRLRVTVGLARDRLLKIIIVGNSGVGKSCLLMRYAENNFTTAFYSTIGVDFVNTGICRK